MAAPLLPDALWERIEPLLPPPKPRRFRYPGRKPLTNRQALTGILFVLKTGIRWNDLPPEMGCDSGSRCRRSRGIKPKFGRRKRAHGSGLGKVRWVVERFISWLHRFGRLRIRTDRSSQMQDAFLQLAGVLICLSFLQPHFATVSYCLAFSAGTPRTARDSPRDQRPLSRTGVL
jgi:transposase